MFSIFALPSAKMENEENKKVPRKPVNESRSAVLHNKALLRFWHGTIEVLHHLRLLQ
jgi:hypothetical protein